MKPIKVYTTNYCSFCVAAKQLLTKLNLPFEEISLDGEDELRMRLSQENGGWRTVPMIFLGDEFVGGYQELSTLHRKGELMTKVND